MIKANSLTAVLLLLFSLYTAIEAAAINTNLNKGSKKFLLVQFGTTPTYNQRQQEIFDRGLNHHQNSLRIQQQIKYNRRQNELAKIEKIRQAKQSARASIPELESKKDYLNLARAWRTLEEWDKGLDVPLLRLHMYYNSLVV